MSTLQKIREVVTDERIGYCVTAVSPQRLDGDSDSPMHVTSEASPAPHAHSSENMRPRPEMSEKPDYWRGMLKGCHTFYGGHAPHRRMTPICRTLVAGVCALLMVAGCGKKIAPSKFVFNLDEVFWGTPTDQNKPVDEPWREKGLRLAKQKQFDQAIEAFARYVEDEPEEFFGFNAIAVCYKNSGDHSMAMKNFERALEFADSAEERAKVLANIGNLYFSTNKLQAALGYYKEAAAEFEKNPLYLLLIARTFMLLEEPERAGKVLAVAEENRGDLDKYARDDDKGLGYYLMAHCYTGLGQEDKVLKYMELALKANPDKYVRRIEKEMQDQQHLFYTLKDDATVRQLLGKYAARMSPSSWIDQS